MREHGDLNCDLPPSPRPARQPTPESDCKPCLQGPLLNLSALPAAQRRPVWEQMQRARPDLAGWVQDPFVKALRQAFDAEVIVEDFREETE